MDNSNTAPAKPQVHFRTVMLHGFVILPCGSPEHCDFDEDGCENWNVWLREDYIVPFSPNKLTFSDVPEHDKDFTSYDAAVGYARKLADVFDAELDEY